MAAKGESISFEKSFFVGFTNSDGFRPTESRIRGQTTAALAAVQTTRAARLRRGLMVSRKEELDDLIAAFGRQVREEHPNAKRVGCPGRLALTSLAAAGANLRSESILEHVRNCATCLDELKELRLAAKRSQ